MRSGLILLRGLRLLRSCLSCLSLSCLVLLSCSSFLSLVLVVLLVVLVLVLVLLVVLLVVLVLVVLVLVVLLVSCLLSLSSCFFFSSSFCLRSAISRFHLARLVVGSQRQRALVGLDRLLVLLLLAKRVPRLRNAVALSAASWPSVARRNSWPASSKRDSAYSAAPRSRCTPALAGQLGDRLVVVGQRVLGLARLQRGVALLDLAVAAARAA